MPQRDHSHPDSDRDSRTRLPKLLSVPLTQARGVDAQLPMEKEDVLLNETHENKKNRVNVITPLKRLSFD
jgi:hypothetical protein